MHAVGCYSVVSWVKQENSTAEHQLVAAESLAALCAIVTGTDLDAQSQIRSAWLRVLFNQFHDTLGGTCTEEAFEDLRQFYGLARTIADEIITKSTQVIAARADTFIEGAGATDRLQSLNPYVGHYPVPVVVFNPLTWPVTVPLVLPHPAGAVTSGKGQSLPVQNVSSREGTRYSGHAAVVADLPTLGFRVLWLHRGGEAKAIVAEPAELKMENELLSITVDRERGTVTSLRDKRSGREWLEPEGIRPLVLDDNSDTWSHGFSRFNGAERECALEDIRLMECGPARFKLRLTYRWSASVIYLELVLHAGLRYVDLVVRADWSERHRLLKVVVPLMLESRHLLAGIPYGAVERETDGAEEVLQQWIDIYDKSGSGVICSTDCGYAYDATAGRLRLTVLRSPRYADNREPWLTDDVIEHPATDQGWHEVTFRLEPHDAAAAPGTGFRQAAELNLRTPIVTETWHSGSLGSALTGITVHPVCVAATVVKRAEDGDGWVIRLCELSGRGTPASVSIDRLQRTWTGSLHGYEVKTLVFPDEGDKQVREILLTELAGDQPGTTQY